MSTATTPRLEHLQEERAWYALCIANSVAVGLEPRDEDVAAFRAANTAVHDLLGFERA